METGRISCLYPACLCRKRRDIAEKRLFVDENSRKRHDIIENGLFLW